MQPPDFIHTLMFLCVLQGFFLENLPVYDDFDAFAVVFDDFRNDVGVYVVFRLKSCRNVDI